MTSLGVLLRPRSARFPPALRLCGPKRDDFGPDWPGPRTDPKRPKITPKWGPTALRRAPAGSAVPVHGQNPLGQCVGCLFDVFCPQRVSVGPIWARLGPDGVPRCKTENWPYLGLDGANCNSEGAFSPCQPPLLVVSTPQIGPNAPLDAVFV